MVCWKNAAIMSKKEKVKYLMHINGRGKANSRRWVSAQQVMNNWWQWGEGVNNLLGRATGRQKIKNKD